jgi:hypothetical protein
MVDRKGLGTVGGSGQVRAGREWAWARMEEGRMGIGMWGQASKTMGMAGVFDKRKYSG